MQFVAREVVGDKKSLIHNLDPRTKMVLLAITVATSLLLDDLPPLFLLCFVASFFIRNNLRVLIYLVAMIVSAWVLTVLLLFLIGAESSNAFYSLRFFLRFLAISNMGLSLALTTSANALFRGLEKMRVPHSIILMLTLTFRFIFIFNEACKNALYSLKSRGIQLKFSTIVKELSLVLRGITIPLTICMIKTSRDLVSALETRAYGSFTRTSFRDLSFRRIDLLFIVGFLAFACFLVIFGMVYHS